MLKSNPTLRQMEKAYHKLNCFIEVQEMDLSHNFSTNIAIVRVQHQRQSKQIVGKSLVDTQHRTGIKLILIRMIQKPGFSTLVNLNAVKQCIQSMRSPATKIVDQTLERVPT
ncbi:hypothetical protein FGO68_gene14456 [Halteria grandinella]|uniref:Uncharacterized protein n=1 Tax=Halteria grandinella TaxID=5974 RepID=A0A8J8NTP8_HALGN|nr:hypothetical protein FGO68_gene14456 [Halteria grandinella]